MRLRKVKLRRDGAVVDWLRGDASGGTATGGIATAGRTAGMTDWAKRFAIDANLCVARSKRVTFSTGVTLAMIDEVLRVTLVCVAVRLMAEKR